MMKIFVGNLSFEANENNVKKLFEGFGNVVSVAIVMRKEKKAPKSRGFGFVQMPEQQQALAAIAALDGKEFMGRALVVNPARPEAEVQAFTVEARQNPILNNDSALTARRVRHSGKPGRYKDGRRSHSYMKQRGLAGIQEEAKPRKRSQDNPMRWRKRKDQLKPWQKSPGEHKPSKQAGVEAQPLKKAEGKSKPWRKSESGNKPWKKAGIERRPWKKTEGKSKPWRKSRGRTQKTRKFR